MNKQLKSSLVSARNRPNVVEQAPGQSASSCFSIDRKPIDHNIASVVNKMGLPALESAGEAILITDLGARILYVNPAFERITGYSRQEAIGQNPRILNSGQQNPAFYQDLWETITGGKVWRCSFINRRKDGTLYDVEQTISAVMGDDGNMIGYVSVHEDVTERVRIEADMRDAESRLACEQYEHELELARTELKIARSVQQRFFPRSAPETAGFDIAGAAFPAEQTCGDYYDFIPMASDSLGVVIADVSGHGLGPALLMAETRAYLRALAQTLDTVEEIVEQTNRFLERDFEDDRFISMFFARLYPKRHLLDYVAAGHTGYHFDRQDKLTVLGPTGLVLGIEDDAHVATAPEIRLRPGELVLLMTDGLCETHSPDTTAFGIDRIVALVRAHRRESAEAIIHTLHDAARGFAQNKPQQDDITIVVIKVAEG